MSIAAEDFTGFDQNLRQIPDICRMTGKVADMTVNILPVPVRGWFGSTGAAFRASVRQE